MKNDKPKELGKIEKDLIAVEVFGDDISIWNDHRPRFLKRLWNTIKSAFNKGHAQEETATSELNDIIDNAADALNERLKSPSLVNLERQANLQKILAETRRINLEADRLEINNEIERIKAQKEKLMHSQEIINLLTQNGNIRISEENGETLIFYDADKKRIIDL